MNVGIFSWQNFRALTFVTYYIGVICGSIRFGFWVKSKRLSTSPPRALPAAHFDRNERYAYFGERTRMYRLAYYGDVATGGAPVTSFHLFFPSLSF